MYNLKHLFTNEKISHIGIIAFSISTILNVKEYLVYTKHPVEFSWVLSIALGIILVSMSFMLSKSDRKSPAFKLKLISTLLLCLLSGTIQTLNYQIHGLHWPIAALFGYGFPIVAEMLLAMSVSLHHKEMQDLKALKTEETIKIRIAESIAQSFETIDVSENSKYIADKIQEVVKAQTDAIILQMMPDSKHTFKTEDLKPFKDEPSISKEDFEIEDLNFKEEDVLKDDFKTDDSKPLKDEEEIQIGNSKAPIKINDKYNVFVHQIENIYNGDIHNFDKKEMAEKLETSVQTIYNYAAKYRKNKKC
jgi:hypothetical protein